jgi:hypothetical protein
MFEGVNRIRHERTEELAREVLHDLKCLENCKIQCCWFGASPHAHREARVPGIVLQFEYPDENLSPSFAIAFANNGFANGTPTHDAKIKYIIREKVEKYLKMIGKDPGINTPFDMRLNEEYYA